ncbi:MAG TPA: response regulator [Flavisolibacter sp.]|nr:response regulator [Flavisolibacter sp.]
MNNILIIEDNKEVRENTAELLELSNYNVITASNGYLGFEMAKKFRPDLILCDMMMPETDGNAFLQLAREDGTLAGVPLIFFTAGSPNLELHTRMINLGHQFLFKPFTEEALLGKIQTGLLQSKASYPTLSL